MWCNLKRCLTLLLFASVQQVQQNFKMSNLSRLNIGDNVTVVINSKRTSETGNVTDELRVQQTVSQ